MATKTRGRTCGHPECDRPLSPRSRTGYCGPHYPLGAFAYEPCSDCGVQLGPRSSTGRCNACHCRHVGKSHAKAPVPCTIDGCREGQVARGWCSTHWARWRRSGDPEAPSPYDPIEVRFWRSVDVGHPLGCWEWTGTTCTAGYGVLSIDGRQEKAHRVAYALLMGDIPEGLVLDHLCRNPPCVNPDHLEPVTNAENVLRGYSVPANRARRRDEGRPERSVTCCSSPVCNRPAIARGWCHTHYKRWQTTGDPRSDVPVGGMCR